MNRRSVKHTLTMTCLMLVLLASLLLGATSIFSIRNTTNMALTEYESAMDSGYNTEIKSEVQTVIAVLQAEYDKSQAGELTEEEAKAEAKEIVRAMRYRDDGSGYFWIDDTDYNLVMHPILAEQEGNNRYDLEDQNGVMIIQEIMKVCNSADGGGFNEFYFKALCRLGFSIIRWALPFHSSSVCHAGSLLRGCRIICRKMRQHLDAHSLSHAPHSQRCGSYPSPRGVEFVHTPQCLLRHRYRWYDSAPLPAVTHHSSVHNTHRLLRILCQLSDNVVNLIRCICRLCYRRLRSLRNYRKSASIPPRAPPRSGVPVKADSSDPRSH